jgi:hypothetical protein
MTYLSVRVFGGLAARRARIENGVSDRRGGRAIGRRGVGW